MPVASDGAPALDAPVASSTPSDVALAAAAPQAKVTATQISLGHASCVTTTTGEVWCWGDGDAGQFGDHTRERSRTVPKPVPGLTGVAYVDARSGSPCALKKDGTVWCWGMTLGQTSPEARDLHAWGHGVAQVQGLSNIVQISSEGSRLLARRADGAVLLWGKPFQEVGPVQKRGYKKPSIGQKQLRRVTQPIELPSLRGAVDITEGSGAMPTGCARMQDGAVKCWSKEKFLGEGWGSELLVEVPTSIPAAFGAKELAVGDDFACARMADGSVRCWGKNTDGQLGDGTTADHWTPAPVKGLTGAVALSVGAGFVCATLGDRSARCWGKPLDISLFADGSPPRVQALPRKLGVAGIKEIALDVWSACARVARAGDTDPNGSLVCWGKNHFAELGDGTRDDRDAPVLVALPGASGAMPSVTRAPALPSAPQSAPVSISAGGDGTCAAFADGSVRCWGESSHLGNGTSDDRPCPVLADVTTATQVSLGSSHACARLSDGHVKCWGTNYGGQLGNGAHDSGTSIPVDARLERVTKIAAGSWTCALLENKKVSCFGDWDDGERSGSFLPRDVGVTDATDVSAGGQHGCALLGNGSVKCFGARWSSGISSAPLAFRDVAAIASSGGSCAVKKDGTVTCWGTFDVPQIPSRTDPRAPAVAPLWADAAQLSMGDEVACAVRSDGTVLCQEDKKLPAVVPGISQVVEVSTGREHACARTRDGKLLCWGANDHGQLGDGTTTARPTPAEVAWCTSAPKRP